MKITPTRFYLLLACNPMTIVKCFLILVTLALPTIAFGEAHPAKMNEFMAILKNSDFSTHINGKTTLTPIYHDDKYDVLYFDRISLESQRETAELIIFTNMNYSHDYNIEPSRCLYRKGHINCLEPGINLQSKVKLSDIIRARRVLISGYLEYPWRGKKQIRSRR